MNSPKSIPTESSGYTFSQYLPDLSVEYEPPAASNVMLWDPTPLGPTLQLQSSELHPRTSIRLAASAFNALKESFDRISSDRDDTNWIGFLVSVSHTATTEFDVFDKGLCVDNLQKIPTCGRGLAVPVYAVNSSDTHLLAQFRFTFRSKNVFVFNKSLIKLLYYSLFPRSILFAYPIYDLRLVENSVSNRLLSGAPLPLEFGWIAVNKVRRAYLLKREPTSLAIAGLWVSGCSSITTLDSTLLDLCHKFLESPIKKIPKPHFLLCLFAKGSSDFRFYQWRLQLSGEHTLMAEFRLGKEPWMESTLTDVSNSNESNGVLIDAGIEPEKQTNVHVSLRSTPTNSIITATTQDKTAFSKSTCSSPFPCFISTSGATTHFSSPTFTPSLSSLSSTPSPPFTCPTRFIPSHPPSSTVSTPLLSKPEDLIPLLSSLLHQLQQWQLSPPSVTSCNQNSSYKVETKDIGVSTEPELLVETTSIGINTMDASDTNGQTFKVSTTTQTVLEDLMHSIETHGAPNGLQTTLPLKEPTPSRDTQDALTVIERPETEGSLNLLVECADKHELHSTPLSTTSVFHNADWIAPRSFSPSPPPPSPLSRTSSLTSISSSHSQVKLKPHVLPSTVSSSLVSRSPTPSNLRTGKEDPIHVPSVSLHCSPCGLGPSSSPSLSLDSSGSHFLRSTSSRSRSSSASTFRASSSSSSCSTSSFSKLDPCKASSPLPRSTFPSSLSSTSDSCNLPLNYPSKFKNPSSSFFDEEDDIYDFSMASLDYLKKHRLL